MATIGSDVIFLTDLNIVKLALYLAILVLDE
jgi:hypothetical protein